MLNVMLQIQPGLEYDKSANAFSNGDLFYDTNGNLYLRCEGGCLLVRIDEEGLVVFNNDTMADFTVCPFFKKCAIAPLDITINVEHT